MEERPIECASCKRKATITYKEVASGKLSVTNMCATCPLLHKKFLPTKETSLAQAVESSLICTSCQTSMQEVVTEGKLGCPQCYQVFEKVLVKELTGKNSPSIREEFMPEKEKKLSFHLGNTPDKLKESHLSLRLESLQAALGEALALENYEKAAGIRDQIKVILEGKDGTEPQAP